MRPGSPGSARATVIAATRSGNGVDSRQRTMSP